MRLERQHIERSVGTQLLTETNELLSICNLQSAIHRAHVRCRPPSIEIVSPVIQPEAGDARK